MSAELAVYVCLALGLSSALVAGVFQSFSDFVMRSLVAAQSGAGIEAMQMINRKVYRSVFLVMLLGLVPATIGLSAVAYANFSGAGLNLIVAGTIIYLVTVFGVTMVGNVPMNNRLDRLVGGTDEADNYWRIYGSSWTRLNHVRTIGSVATAVCLLLAAVALD